MSRWASFRESCSRGWINSWRRGLSRVVRAVVCGVLGYPAIAAGWYIGLNKVGLRSIDDYFYLGCLYAVIPAALCSWLAGRQASASSASS